MVDWYLGLELTKDPDSTLDYVWDFSNWLASGDTVSTHVVTAEAGITVDDSSNDTDSVTVWLSGGTDGEAYDVAVKITTTQNRIVERTISVAVAQQ